MQAEHPLDFAVVLSAYLGHVNVGGRMTGRVRVGMDNVGDVGGVIGVDHFQEDVVDEVDYALKGVFVVACA